MIRGEKTKQEGERDMTANAQGHPIRRTARIRRAGCVAVRRELDPAFYPDLFAFRKAVADGSIDPANGCRNMDEYLASVAHGKV